MFRTGEPQWRNSGIMLGSHASVRDSWEPHYLIQYTPGNIWRKNKTKVCMVLFSGFKVWFSSIAALVVASVSYNFQNSFSFKLMLWPKVFVITWNQNILPMHFWFRQIDINTQSFPRECVQIIRDESLQISISERHREVGSLSQVLSLVTSLSDAALSLIT